VGQQLEDLEVLIELAQEEKEESLAPEIEAELQRARQQLEQLELRAMLSGEYDDHDAILSINVGAGGTEAHDWAEMLLRMYLRWAERHGYETELIEVSPGEEAGIKTAVVLVHGPHAYGFLRAEKGTHRLVRLSPFDFNNRRHTSFAGVNVIPQVDDGIEVEINEDYLEMDTYRSQGAGGQHVNKTDSAVRLTYRPPGEDPIIVQCQNERSQHKNRAIALQVLKARLFEREQQKQRARLAELRGEVSDYAWGNQIRSYVLHPYKMVKDLRTDVETSNTTAVLDGDLDPFIYAYLRQTAGQKNHHGSA